METSHIQNETTLRAFMAEDSPDDVVRRYAALADFARTADFACLDGDIVVVDVEATGLSLTHDEIIQIAAARLKGNEVIERFDMFVNPGRAIPKDIVHLTHITDEDVKGAPTPAEALTQFREFARSARLVAHNADYDRGFITKYPEGEPLKDNIWIDSLALARIVLPKMKSHRLLDLARAFHTSLSTHRADADVEATCQLFRILLAGIVAMPASLIGKIATFPDREGFGICALFSVFAYGLRSTGQESDALPALFEEQAATHEKSNAFAFASGRIDCECVPDTWALKRQFSEMQGKAFAREAEAFSLHELRGRYRFSERQSLRKDAEELLEKGEPLNFPDAGAIERFFSKEGGASLMYDDYSLREEQRMMAQEVNTCFSRYDNLAVEAGTGVGKSLAYLVPSALFAVQNGIGVGVATKTNVLLDQLMYKELPALSEALQLSEDIARPLVFASLKGFTHYVCLHKVDRLLRSLTAGKTNSSAQKNERPLPDSALNTKSNNAVSLDDSPASQNTQPEEDMCEVFEALACLLSFVEQSELSDCDSIKLNRKALPRWRYVAEKEECLRHKCPYFGTTCFVHEARRHASRADIVLTNHSMLFCDIAAEGGVLPPLRHWIIDEAHGVENTCREAFSFDVSAEELLSLAEKLISVEPSRNVLMKAAAAQPAFSLAQTKDDFAEALDSAQAQALIYAQAAKTFAHSMKLLLRFQERNSNKSYEYVDVWINDAARDSDAFAALTKNGENLLAETEKLVSLCQKLVVLLDDRSAAAELQRELASLVFRVNHQAQAAKIFLARDAGDYVYAAKLNKNENKANDKLTSMIFSVDNVLVEHLYSYTYSVVYTSATLAVAGSLDGFAKTVGLNVDETSRAHLCCLPSSFDFDNNMTIYVASDMPEPSGVSYLSALESFLYDIHAALSGSVLTLFTNRREMEQCHQKLSPRLQEEGLRLLCQRWGLSTKALRDEFLADKQLSLFATKSFWEGFDAPGATLRGVVIPKLPFARPTDPLSCERASRDKHAWTRYILPEAIIETKQAVGRLIRKADDTGVVVFADSRLITKSYGRTFLASMPGSNIKTLKRAEIIAELQREAQL